VLNADERKTILQDMDKYASPPLQQPFGTSRFILQISAVINERARHGEDPAGGGQRDEP